MWIWIWIWDEERGYVPFLSLDLGGMGWDGMVGSGVEWNGYTVVKIEHCSVYLYHEKKQHSLYLEEHSVTPNHQLERKNSELYLSHPSPPKKKTLLHLCTVL